MIYTCKLNFVLLLSHFLVNVTDFTHQQRFVGKYISNIGPLRFNFLDKDFFFVIKAPFTATPKEPAPKIEDRIFT